MGKSVSDFHAHFHSGEVFTTGWPVENADESGIELEQGSVVICVWKWSVPTGWCPSSWMLYIFIYIYISRVNGDYKATYNLGVPPCINGVSLVLVTGNSIRSLGIYVSIAISIAEITYIQLDMGIYP